MAYTVSKITKLKGFALLGRATQKQLENYKIHYQGHVEIEFTPIWEAHKFLEAWLHKSIPASSDDHILNWLQTRQYIANWQFDVKDLEVVMGLWQEIQRMQEERWTIESTMPEKNYDFIK